MSGNSLIIAFVIRIPGDGRGIRRDLVVKAHASHACDLGDAHRILLIPIDGFAALLTLIPLVAYFANTKSCKKPVMAETLACGYSSESTQ